MEYIVTEDLVKEARGWLRIGVASRNDEIRQVLTACLVDLKNGGVVKRDPADPMIKQAMKLYLKAQFGYDADADRFAQSYEFLKYSLALSGDYNKEASDGTIG